MSHCWTSRAWASSACCADAQNRGMHTSGMHKVTAGHSRPFTSGMAVVVRALNAGPAPVLAVDVPSGLAADSGTGQSAHATHTLSLLTLKPGLFTAQGRDAAGQAWFDDLGVTPTEEP